MMASFEQTPDSDQDESSSGFASPSSPSPIDSPVRSASPSSLSSLSATPAAQDPSSIRPSSALPLTHSASTSNMTNSSTPLGNLNAARRPNLPPSTLSSRGGLPPEMEARMKAFHLGRQGAPPSAGVRTGLSQSSTAPGSPASPKVGMGGIPSNFRLPPGIGRPPVQSYNSSPAAAARGPPPAKPSMAERRGMKMPGGLPGSQPAPGAPPPGKKRPGLTLSAMNAGQGGDGNQAGEQGSGSSNGAGSLLDKYSNFIDKETGSLRFKGKAMLTNQGVEFTGGKTFSISLDEVDTLDELGKGNYGTVYKVRHSRPRMRRPGLGLAGNKALPGQQQQQQSATSPRTTAGGMGESSPPASHTSGGTSGMVMAMKEIRLELDDAKFAAIIMELDILHRCVSPYIIDFYGAFFQEGAVYICIEFMDGGSIDKLYAGGMPESVLRKVALATVHGLKSLKDDHNIIHRDVKPTNILVNTRGQIKICDFGVSGNLVASIAKTNIGCQSYMAPERISSGGVAQAGANPGGGTYSVQSDIWSLGLTLIECALGQYPYPPETYDNIFSQLSAIVDGAPPDLPADRFSEEARNFVAGCLHKIPKLRLTYAMLLQHAWLAPVAKPATIVEADEEAAEKAAETGQDMEVGDVPGTSGAQADDAEVAEWANGAIERRRSGGVGKKVQPALHAAPLDSVVSPAATGAA